MSHTLQLLGVDVARISLTPVISIQYTPKPFLIILVPTAGEETFVKEVSSPKPGGKKACAPRRKTPDFSSGI